MPNWDRAGAKRHTKQARKSDVKARAFDHAANSAASRGLSEASQIRIGNYAASRAGRGMRKSKRS